MNYQDYQLASSSRKREAIEWSDTRHYNAPDRESPRVLLIGDSICNGYHGGVRERLKDCVNISYWVSSKCVTDNDYLRELNYMLESYPYDLILFNNGCHSLSTDKKEWAEAYDKAIRFIRDKVPAVKLTVVCTTPLKVPERNEIVKEMNVIAKAAAEKYGVPVLDLFTPFDPLDREVYWGDCFHLKENGRELLADRVAEHIRSRLDIKQKNLVQQATETGPDGALK